VNGGGARRAMATRRHNKRGENITKPDVNNKHTASNSLAYHCSNRLSEKGRTDSVKTSFPAR
jgi:hypothetical protein